MKAITGGICGLTAAMMVAAPAGATPDINCPLVTPVTEVPGVAQLPAPLKTLIGPMADVGAPFRYEHGGITYFWQAVVARVRPDGTVIPVANAGTVDDKLCAITDGAFTGTVPPYPDDSWQASGF